MTSFDERERAFEAKFAHDEELRFKIKVRRDYLLGLWAAGVLGHRGADQGVYASHLRSVQILGADDEALIAAIANDFRKAGVSMDRASIHTKLAECLREAQQDYLAGAQKQ